MLATLRDPKPVATAPPPFQMFCTMCFAARWMGVVRVRPGRPGRVAAVLRAAGAVLRVRLPRGRPGALIITRGDPLILPRVAALIERPRK